MYLNYVIFYAPFVFLFSSSGVRFLKGERQGIHFVQWVYMDHIYVCYFSACLHNLSNIFQIFNLKDFKF